MFKKTVEYVDYNGVTRTEDCYFNLTKAELFTMQFSSEIGYSNLIQRLIDTKDTVKLLEMFKDLIHKAYGIKSDDGRRFIKSDEISTAFEQTPAYDQIFMELASDVDKAAEFINRLAPADLEVSEAERKKILKSIS